MSDQNRSDSAGGFHVTEQEVQRIYRRRFSEADKKAKGEIWRVIVEKFFQKWVKDTDVVVDLGCGYGEFLNYLKAHRRIGVDLNPDSPLHLEKGIEFHQGSVCDLHFLAENSVDFVFTSNLMEHLPGKREVEQMIREVRRVLRPGGHFVMMGPNIRVVKGQYWDFWDHVVPISDRSLVEALENIDFEVVDAYERFLPYTTRSALPQSPILVRMYLACPAVWQILGGQFLVRARKPANLDGNGSDNKKQVSVVVPVYNEGGSIANCLRGIHDALRDQPHEILVVYDFDGDTTLPAIREMDDRPCTLRLIKNDIGRGVACALKAGFAAAQGDVIVTTMADLSDPPTVIPAMAAKIRRGADVVSGSRYMRGGSQTGGPLLKSLLSRIAGLSLRYIAGVKTHDATTNFRAYSARFLQKQRVESDAGFEVALELTIKAHLQGATVSEVPSSWVERTSGESKFQLKKWLPRYLRWYRKAMVRPLLVWSVWGGCVMVSVVSLFFRASPLGKSCWKYLLRLHVTGLDAFGRWISVHTFAENQTAEVLTSMTLLACASAACLLALRYLRGHMKRSDLLMPLLAFWLGHYSNDEPGSLGNSVVVSCLFLIFAIVVFSFGARNLQP